MKKFVMPCMSLLALIISVPAAAPSQTEKPAQPAATNQAQSGTPTAPTDKPAATAAASPTPAGTQAAAEEKSPPPPATKQTPSGPQTTPAGKPASSAKKSEPPDPGYVIGAEDVLVIDVWQEKEFSSKCQVRPDGKITLPLLNDVTAVGLTPTELASALTKMLEKYVDDPRVTVIVEQINSRNIYLSGEVNRPGLMPLLRNMTVLQALTVAGGPNQFAKANKIYVMRTVNGKTTKYPFDWKKTIKEGPGKDNIVLQPGDTIVVP